MTFDDFLAFLADNSCAIQLNSKNKYVLQSTINNRALDKTKLGQLHLAAALEHSLDAAAFDNLVVRACAKKEELRQAAKAVSTKHQSTTANKNRHFLLDCDTYMYDDIRGQYAPVLYSHKKHYAKSAPNLFGAGDGLDEEERKDFLENRTVKVMFSYEPHKSKLLEYDEVFDSYNTYVPPFWLRDFFYTGAKPQMIPSQPPACIIRHLRNICLYDSGVDYILDWMCQSLRGRNMATLCLIGKPGSGKGLLWEVLKALHGDENTADNIPTNFFEGGFNGMISDKTLMIANECKISEEGGAAYRQLIDDTISITRKGKETVTEKNHLSFACSANDIKDIRVQANDRRMSIIDLKDISLETTLPNKADMDAYIAELRDKEMLAELGAYLKWNHVLKHNMSTNLKTDKWRVAVDISTAKRDWFGDGVDAYLENSVRTNEKLLLDSVVSAVKELYSTDGKLPRITKADVKAYISNNLSDKYKFTSISPTNRNMEAIVFADCLQQDSSKAASTTPSAATVGKNSVYENTYAIPLSEDDDEPWLRELRESK
jgi:hypothetical protein